MAIIERRIAKSGRANVAVGAEAVHHTESGTRKYQCNGPEAWERDLQALADKVAGRKGAPMGIGIRAALAAGLGVTVGVGDVRAVDLVVGKAKGKPAKAAPKAKPAKASPKAKASKPAKAPGKAKAPRKAKPAAKAHTAAPAGAGGAESAS